MNRFRCWSRRRIWFRWSSLVQRRRLGFLHCWCACIKLLNIVAVSGAHSTLIFPTSGALQLLQEALWDTPMCNEEPSATISVFQTPLATVFFSVGVKAAEIPTNGCCLIIVSLVACAEAQNGGGVPVGAVFWAVLE